MRDSRGWIVGLLILGALVTWLMSHPMRKEAVGVGPDNSPSTGPSMGPAVKPSSAATSQSQSDAPAARAAPAAAANGAATCIEQYVDVTAKEKKQRSCVSRTQTIQNGNVRSYRVESQGGAVSSLRVDAAGERILHAELATGSGEPFACGAGHCGGISMGAYDAQGARTLVLDKARLTRQDQTEGQNEGQNEDDGEGDSESLVVDGRLRTLPDDQLSSSSCAGQVLLVTQGAGTLHFCPDSGTGFDLDDQGGTTYRFTNHDGNTLSVLMNRAGALQRVELGKLACIASACSGVMVASADPDGRREFRFSGTTLPGNGPESTPALLNGTVVLGAQ